MENGRQDEVWEEEKTKKSTLTAKPIYAMKALKNWWRIMAISIHSWELWPLSHFSRSNTQRRLRREEERMFVFLWGNSVRLIINSQFTRINSICLLFSQTEYERVTQWMTQMNNIINEMAPRCIENSQENNSRNVFELKEKHVRRETSRYSTRAFFSLSISTYVRIDDGEVSFIPKIKTFLFCAYNQIKR